MDYGGENFIELVKNYFKNVVVFSLGNYNGDIYFYYYFFVLILGGKFYKNGGNIYYLCEV